MNRTALPKQIFSDWEVEFTGCDGDQTVDCVATVVLDYDGSAYEVLRACYVTPDGTVTSYTPSEHETEKLFRLAQKQFDNFMEEA